MFTVVYLKPLIWHPSEVRRRGPMFQYLRGIVLVAAMMFSGAAVCEIDESSANFLMPACRAYLARSMENLQFQGVCIGIIEGIGYAASGFVCSPPGVSLDQAFRVVVKYIEDRPERQHEKFKALVPEALRAAWPCKN